MRKNWRRGGVRGLQGGLTLGVAREFFFNGIRIGSFEPLVRGVHVAVGGDEGAPPSGAERLTGGLAAGALGGFLINPIDVAKTRAQALGGETGHQHAASERGAAGALRALVADEGWRGLLRGIGTNTFRGLLGPGSQIVAYTALKDRAVEALGPWAAAAVGVHVACSLASAAVSVALVNPVDVLRTRLFNQPFGPSGDGLWYRSGWDAGRKVVAKEGPLALYKGQPGGHGVGDGCGLWQRSRRRVAHVARALTRFACARFFAPFFVVQGQGRTICDWARI